MLEELIARAVVENRGGSEYFFAHRVYFVVDIELCFERAHRTALRLEQSFDGFGERDLFVARLELQRAVKIQLCVFELLRQLCGKHEITEDIGNGQRVRFYLLVIGGHTRAL